MVSRIAKIILWGSLLILSSCHVGRYFAWNLADVNDHQKFPAILVQSGSSPFHFYRNIDQDLFNEISYQNKNHNLDSLLRQKKSKTIAFLVIRNDTILYEEYFGKFNQHSLIPSFSVTKSFTSALIGIAIEEGYIPGVDTPVSDFLPELCNTSEEFEQMTIENLLNMRSGIDFNERAYLNPFKGISKLYYGTNLKKQSYNVKVKGTPDEYYEYQSINTQLLGLLLERATGISPARYLQEKIWKPLGMESHATWSIDSRKNKTVKAYCCLNATTRDFAKFGRLYLNHGEWNGNQVVPENWVKKSITPTPPYKRYQYHWYSMTRPVYFNDSLSAASMAEANQRVRKSRRYPGKYYINKFGPAFVASGLLGQAIYVDPSKNLIIVRMGKRRGNIGWWELFERISEKM